VVSGIGPVLRTRNFALLTAAGSMSQLGDRLTHMLLITVIGMTAPGSLLAYSGGAFAFVLPTLVLSPFAGVLVDHWDRRRTIARAHFIQAALIALAPLAIALTGSFVPFWVVLVLFFGIDIFNNTAAPALIPALVHEDQLLAANSVNLAFARVATVVGMVAGGYLISSLRHWLGPDGAWRVGLWIDAACHLAAALLALAMVLPHVGAGQARAVPRPPLRTEAGRALRVFVGDMIEVMRLVFRDRVVAFVLASVVVSTFVSAVAYTVLIFIVQQVLGLGTAGVGVLSGILAVGMIGGAVTMGFLPPRVSRPPIVAGSVLCFGLLFAAGYWLIELWFIAIVALVAGAAFSWLGILQSTMLQEEVPEGVRGRIFSTREFVTNSTFLLTALVIGALGDLAGYRTVLITIGAALTLLALLGFVWVRGLKPTPKD
jgi:MFS family permease